MGFQHTFAHPHIPAHTAHTRISNGHTRIVVVCIRIVVSVTVRTGKS